jgi:hypothetical protein
MMERHEIARLLVQQLPVQLLRMRETARLLRVQCFLQKVFRCHGQFISYRKPQPSVQNSLPTNPLITGLLQSTGWKISIRRVPERSRPPLATESTSSEPSRLSFRMEIALIPLPFTSTSRCLTPKARFAFNPT